MFDMNDFKLNGMNINIQKTVESIAIEDIMVVNARKKEDIHVPQGYEKIDQDLNEGSGGDYIYLCFKRGTDSNRAINGIEVISGRNDRITAPSGFERINVDVNKGSGGKYIYICIRRGKENPITDLRIVSGKSKDLGTPEGFTLIKKDLNEGSGGKYIYLCYR